MNYIYFSLCKFFETAPRKDEASGWAAVFVPTFFAMNVQVVLYVAELVLHRRIVPNGLTAVVWIATAILAFVSYIYFDAGDRGRRVVASMTGSKSAKVARAVGGVICLETFFGWAIPAIIAVIQNPRPWEHH
jgi:predicted permease